MKQTVIVFDINETVLDLSTLRPTFHLAFGDPSCMDTWFAMLLHASTVSTVTGVTTDFATLAKISLEALAAKRGVQLPATTVADILIGFSRLPAHGDIKPSLSKLRMAEFRVAALSNSSVSLVNHQINNAGLSDDFDEIISVEEARTFKPSLAAYRFASATLGQVADKIRLVATHDWDTHGALCAGLQAAYIDRSGVPYHPLYKKPNICGATMGDIVDQIIAIEPIGR